jgi:protein-tyrosine-phosphatase
VVEKTKREEKMNILFICKYNAFRSRIAEEYFRKTNKNPKIKTASRGLIMGGVPDKEQIQISKQILGIKINKRKALPVKKSELKEADLIIVVADDVPRIIFNYKGNILQKKVVIWKIKDEQKRNQNNIKSIVLQIKDKVEELNRKLRK